MIIKLRSIVSFTFLILISVSVSANIHKATSDIIAVNIEAMTLPKVKTLLSKANITDSEHKWTQKGKHLVIFSRQSNAKQLNDVVSHWISLEQQVEESGGRLFYLNHVTEKLVAHESVIESTNREWLSQQPALIQINDTIFSYAGLSKKLPNSGIAELNAHYASMNAQELSKDPYSPSQYKGSMMCHAFTEHSVFTHQIKRLNATRTVIASSHDSHTRFDNQLLSLAPLAQQFLTLSNNSYTLMDSTTLALSEFIQAPTVSMPYSDEFSEEEMLSFLSSAEIVSRKAVGKGVTKPIKLTLSAKGKSENAIYKTINTHPRVAKGGWSSQNESADQYQYEIAAYLLNQELGLNMIPAVVAREIGGKTGSVQYWLHDTITDKTRESKDIEYAGICQHTGQYVLMRVFDGLIGNRDRNQGNILHDEANWQLWMIDHSRAFSGKNNIKEKSRISAKYMSPEYKKALSALSIESLTVLLGDLLNKRQIQMLIERRDRLVQIANEHSK